MGITQRNHLLILHRVKLDNKQGHINRTHTKDVWDPAAPPPPLLFHIEIKYSGINISLRLSEVHNLNYTFLLLRDDGPTSQLNSLDKTLQ